MAGIQILVRNFNKLMRPRKSPSGLVDNHWHFAVIHFPLKPPRDMVLLVNPGSAYGHCQGPAQIQSQSTITAQAEIIVQMLLEAFVGGLGCERPGRVPPYGPWSWGTMDLNLATAVGARLRSLGVHDELCRIRAGDENDDKVLRGVINRIMTTLMNMLEPEDPCAICNKGEEEIAGQLRFCSGCTGIRYCSVECQKADWKRHRKDCMKAQKITTPTNKSRVILPYEYFSQIAPTKPEAQELADEIDIKFPRASLGSEYAVRALVVAGKDTPENLAILFGPRSDADHIEMMQTKARLDVLLQPPPGSRSWDDYVGMSVRDPSATELEYVRRIRDMQNRITKYMGSRPMSDWKAEDMEKCLQANFGNNWLGQRMLCYDAVDLFPRSTHVA